MNVLIIGGGPAGMLAGIKAAEEGNAVTILEKNNSFGKKLLITGKGRCNITSGLEISEFINNTPGNARFLYSAFDNFNNNDIIQLLKEEGLAVKEERGNRIFPVTDKAMDVLNALLSRIKKLKVNIKLNCRVNKIITRDGMAVGVVYNGSEEIYADKIILATGGMSYPNTGSTGDGYKMATELGHTIKDIKPSLVPFETYQRNECKRMQGLGLKNVGIQIKDIDKNKIIYEDFGEMLFTHFGVSGPVIISASAHLIRYKKIEELFKNKKIRLIIDLKPALTLEKLDDRILRDFAELKNKKFKNSLEKLLPQKMISIILDRLNIDQEKQVNEITKEERLRIVNLFKNFDLEISSFRPIDEAIITAGGISIKEINPKTMESKLVPNLYFAGEIIDVDAYTGGFNLQIAYSTGYTAGKIIIKMRKDHNMIEEFKSIKFNNCEEIIEKKSRFIANLIYVNSEEEAVSKIREIKKKYHDARHNCFAYRVLSEHSIIQRSSDDGEPSGTAGAPMLNILEKNNIVNALLVVTRYFGGILLGTGGLVKAYSEASLKVLNENQLEEKEIGFEVLFSVPYSEVKRVEYFLKTNNIVVSRKDYVENVMILTELPQDKYKEIEKEFPKNVNKNIKYEIKQEKIISKNTRK